MVFANPGFVVAELVKVLHQCHVAIKSRGRVFMKRVERGEKNTKSKSFRAHSDIRLFIKQEADYTLGRMRLARVSREHSSDKDNA